MHADGVSRKGPTGHVEQPRLEGTHTHRSSLPVVTGDIGDAPSHGPSQGDFSGARSGSLFASSAYRDPYAEQQQQPASPTTNGPPSYMRQSLAQRLGSAFSSSSPDLIEKDFNPAFTPEDTPATAPLPGRRRFALSPVRKGSREASPGRTGAGVPHRRAQGRRGEGRGGSARASGEQARKQRRGGRGRGGRGGARALRHEGHALSRGRSTPSPLSLLVTRELSLSLSRSLYRAPRVDPLAG